MIAPVYQLKSLKKIAHQEWGACYRYEIFNRCTQQTSIGYSAQGKTNLKHDLTRMLQRLNAVNDMGKFNLPER